MYDVRSDNLLAGLPCTDAGLPRAGSAIIYDRLGKGGVGAVYLGFDEKLHAEVAVKVMNFEMAENTEMVERFFREARATFKVDHPNVVRILTVDAEAGTHYMVMEFIDGESGEDRLRREGALPERDALEITVGTGEALAAAHEAAVLHRDVKPANIMIRFRDGRVKLADLGLAKALGKEAQMTTGLTASGQIMGTPSYMSPEQATDASSTDERTDIYSLGATLYAFLAGRPPFEATQLFDLLNKVTREKPQDLRTIRPDVSTRTVGTIRRLMAKHPAQRPETMQDALRLLRACLGSAPTEGARGLARPDMAGKRKSGRAAEDFTPTPTPGRLRRFRSTKPFTRSPAASRSPTPVVPRPRQAPDDGAAWEDPANTPPTISAGLGATPAISKARDRARTSDRATTAAVEEAPPEARLSGGKKLAITLAIAAVLAVAVVYAWSAVSRRRDPLKLGAVQVGSDAEVKAAAFRAEARTLRDKGDFQGARKLLADALDLMPEHAELKREFFEIEAMIGAKQASVERAAEYRKRMERARGLKLLGKLEEAALAYSAAARYAPLGSAEASEAAADCLVERYETKAIDAEDRGDLEGAVRLYEKALEAKDDPATRAALAETKARLAGEPVEDTGPGHWLRRAEEAELSGNIRTARRYYRQAARRGADVAAKIASLERELRKTERVTADAARAPTLRVDIGRGMGMEMAYIGSGPFLMGSDSGDPDETPVREVLISKGFYLGKYEVTQEQYQFVVGTNPSHFKRANGPVERVSWDDAVVFCRKLTARTKSLLSRSGCGGWTFRLPTEAEWECAARAGSRSAYFFGDDEAGLDDYAWYSGNSGKQTHAVGQKRRGRNPWGLYDVYGNVGEWCADWYDRTYYARSPREDPRGPSSGTARVVRGGSWNLGPEYCRSADRNKFSPTGRFQAFGFRAALSP